MPSRFGSSRTASRSASRSRRAPTRRSVGPSASWRPGSQTEVARRPTSRSTSTVTCSEPASRPYSPRERGSRPRGSAPGLLLLDRSRRVEGYLAQVLQRRRNHDSFQVYRVDVEEQPQLVQCFRVDAVPALVVVSGNRVRDRAVTPQGCREIEQLLGPLAALIR